MDVLNDAPGSVFAPGLVFQTRYRIDESVSAGGMAQIWRGEDLVLQRPVAIKLVHPHLANDETVMERFRHEAIAAARLAHPNIVPTFDTGTDHGVSYIVLGLIDGPNLATVLATRTFTPAQTCRLGRQIADALDHAHRQGIIHRDIKPANVLVVDDNERVMVADFGIARVLTESLDPSLTMPGFALGTPEYVAPEVITGKEPAAGVDIFALGILLHEMICGHTIAEVPTQDVGPDGVGKTQVCPNIPIPLDVIITKATQHNAEDRFDSAAEMRDVLNEAELEFRKHEPPEPEPHFEQEPNPTQAIPRIQPSNSSRILTPTNQPVRDVALARVAAQRRRTITFIVISTLILLAIGIGRYFGDLSSNNNANNSTPTLPATFDNATSFDPLGSDRLENEAQAKNALDANPGTSWSTETYGSRKFGNLKQGVGLSLTLPTSSTLNDLKVTSPSNGWSAEIYVANQAGTSLASWGRPVTAATNVASGSTTFNLSGMKGSNVLIWITDLGNANKVAIEEITLNPR